MCTYNGALYLREQLASISGQTLPPDELIICDDQSSDGTLKLLEAFAATAPFDVRIHVNEKRLGSTKNFERAISLCTGEIIALADQDDEWMPHKLARIGSTLRSNESIGAVFTDAEIVDENLRPLGHRLWRHSRFGSTEQGLVKNGRAFELMLNHSFVTGATMAFRSAFKQLVLPIPTSNPHLIHDHWIALLISAVSKIDFIDEPLIKYRQHLQQQIGAQRSSNRLIERFTAPRLKEALTASKQSRADAYQVAIDSLKTIYQRASTYTRDSLRQEVVSALMANIAHYKIRAGMPEQRSRRVRLVLKELLTLRYHRYSSGLCSAARDLC